MPWTMKSRCSIFSFRSAATSAATTLPRKLLERTEVRPKTITTGKLALYSAALRDLWLARRHRSGALREQSRAEHSHLVIRRPERKQHKFKSEGSAQRFLAINAAVYKTFNAQPHLISRPTLRLVGAEAH
jgi:putative transposase